MSIKKSTICLLLCLIASSTFIYAKSSPQHREMLQSSDNNSICFYGIDNKPLEVSVKDEKTLGNSWKVTGSDTINLTINGNCINADTDRNGSTEVTTRLLDKIGNNASIFNTSGHHTNASTLNGDKLNFAFSLENITIDETTYPEVYFAQGTDSDWYVYTKELEITSVTTYSGIFDDNPRSRVCIPVEKNYYLLNKDKSTTIDNIDKSNYKLKIANRSIESFCLSKSSDYLSYCKSPNPVCPPLESNF